MLCKSGRVPFQSLSRHTGVKPWRLGTRSAFRHHERHGQGLFATSPATSPATSSAWLRCIDRNFSDGPLSLCIISQCFRLHSRKDLARTRVGMPSFHLLSLWFLFAPFRRYDSLSPLSRLSTQHRPVRILPPLNTHYRYSSSITKIIH